MVSLSYSPGSRSWFTLCSYKSIATLSTSCKFQAGRSGELKPESVTRPVSLPELQELDIQTNRPENPRELTGDYIAGLVQADGSFSAVLSRKTRNDKEYFHLSLVFTLVQSKKYKDLILDIQKK